MMKQNLSIYGKNMNLWYNNLPELRSDDIGFPNELNLYLKSSVVRLSDNPLHLWKDMKSVYPILSNIAIKYLSTVATSVPSERLFSKAGLTLSNRRNRLTPKHLNKLLFLQSLDDTLWSL